jgi:hypothetical protein
MFAAEAVTERYQENCRYYDAAMQVNKLVTLERPC